MIAEIIIIIICCIVSFIVNFVLCLGIVAHASKNPGRLIDHLWQTGKLGYVTWVIIFTTCIAGLELLLRI